MPCHPLAEAAPQFRTALAEAAPEFHPHVGLPSGGVHTDHTHTKVK
jgi:hypothetical protein